MNSIHCFRVKEARKGLELSVRANATYAILKAARVSS